MPVPILKEQRIFVLGDPQVGKSTFARHMYGDSLICVSSEDDAAEYHGALPGKGTPTRIFEIRDCDYLIENDIECDDTNDVVFFCYAISDLDSFRHVNDMWIPLFRDNVSHCVPSILVGNKKDHRDNAEIVHNLAERGLKPVSTDEGFAVLDDHAIVQVFVEHALANS